MPGSASSTRHFGLILAYVALNVPFTIWLIDGFFRQVPRDLAEAAQIDGCTRWQAFWQVEFPLAGPGIASAAIFAFLTSWNEFALASQLTRSVNSKTLPVGLLDYTAEFTIDWRGMCALAVVMIIPALTLTFIVQKHLVSGLTSGARQRLIHGNRLAQQARQALRHHGGRARHQPRRRRPRIHRAGRPVRLRQVDDAADDRRAGGDQRRRGRGSAAAW